MQFASQGSIFLDEISEIPRHLQVKLLRVLQEKEFERVGGNDTIQLEGRIISATNLDLSNEIKDGRFREDLFYRLNTLTLHIPPLRDRKDDILELSQLFLAKCSSVYGKIINSFDDKAIDTILNYHWPGNVRQLENAVEYATLSCSKDTIRQEHLPGDILLNERLGSAQSKMRRHVKSGTKRGRMLDQIADIEKKNIIEALNENKWNKSKTALELGITRRQLITRINKYKIE